MAVVLVIGETKGKINSGVYQPLRKKSRFYGRREKDW
jgi:hypothetical protein